MSINNEELRALCIEGNMTNGQLAERFGVPATEIYAWRSRHGLTINRCAAIREGRATTGKRTEAEVRSEIEKVEGAKKDAERKFVRASNRLVELRKELGEAKS
jgi:uncharacterized protein YjcR